MNSKQSIANQIRRFQDQIVEAKTELARALHMIATTFEYTANQIDTKSEHFFNDAQYVEHNCSWITEYSRRIANAEHDMKILQDTLNMLENEEN